MTVETMFGELLTDPAWGMEALRCFSCLYYLYLCLRMINFLLGTNE